MLPCFSWWEQAGVEYSVLSIFPGRNSKEDKHWIARVNVGHGILDDEYMSLCYKFDYDEFD